MPGDLDIADSEIFGIAYFPPRLACHLLPNAMLGNKGNQKHVCRGLLIAFYAVGTSDYRRSAFAAECPARERFSPYSCDKNVTNHPLSAAGDLRNIRTVISAHRAAVSDRSRRGSVVKGHFRDGFGRGRAPQFLPLLLTTLRGAQSGPQFCRLTVPSGSR